MVRMTRSSTRQRQIHQQYKLNNKLFARHAINLLLISVIGLSVALYFFLLGLEEKAAAVEEIEISGGTAEQHVVVQQDSASEDIDQQQLLRQRETMKMPGSGILPASRVLSSGLPFLLYGTAWKKDDTAALVAQAVTNGFRFIDTACQPKHYNEPGVGEGWTLAAKGLGLKRSDMFLQTKYTSMNGQDPNNVPYDVSASLEDQARQSLQISLTNLKTDYLDSWVMHSPEPSVEDTMRVYRVMEQAVDDGKVRGLGISNCYDFHKFTAVYEMARIKPKVLQNRFYGESDWDQELRRFCSENGIWYQSFWTLTANRKALATQDARTWAEEKKLTPQTLLYAYLMSLGYGTPLDGTTSEAHMKEDIAVMTRLQNGEKIFENDNELREFERLLGF